MRTLAALFILLSFSEIFSQTTADKYDSAMAAYNNRQFSTAVRLFDNFFTDYNLTDELYATAKYYYSDALLNLGDRSAAATGFEFIINNFKWSSFRENSLYKLGIIYFEEKKYKSSRENLKKLLEEYPDNENSGSALYLIGESYTSQNRLKDAITFLEEAANNKKNNAYLDYTIFALASTYEKTGDYNKAVGYYDQLLSYHQESPLALTAQLRIGICYFKLKDYQSAILELNNPSLTKLSPEIYSECLYLVANSYYREEEYNNAELKYSEVIKDFPSSDVFRDSRYGLAWCYFQQKKYDEAFKIFNSLSAGEDSIAVKSFFWKAESKRYLGDNDQAFKFYNQFLKKYPGNELAQNVRYQLGGYYYDTNDYITSESYLKAATNSENPVVKAKALTMMGEIYLNKKDFEKASDFFNKVINQEGFDKDMIDRAKIGLGTAYYYDNNYDNAIEELSGLSERNSVLENNKINFYLAESYYALGNYKDALNYYNKVSADDSLISGQSLYGKAYCYFNLKDFDNAADFFHNFIRKFPRSKRSVDAKLRLADSYYGNKDYASASRVYKELFAVGSESIDNPYGHYQFAQALYKAGNTDEAINEFMALQLRYPESQYAQGSMYTIGWIYFQKESFDEAISQYRTVIKTYPKSSIIPLVYYSIGDAYFNEARYDSAIANYERVITLYPSSDYVFDAVNGIQYSYVSKNEPQKAISLIDNFVSKNPELSFSDQLFFKKGEIYYSMRQYDKAEVSYKEFVSDYPASKQISEAYYWIGKSAQNLGQKEEAIFNFRKVFDSYPGSEAAGAAVLEIGNIYSAMKDYDSAINIYDQAIDRISKSPRIAEIMFMKGVSYSNKLQPDNAYGVFQDVVQNYDGTIFADKAKFELGLIELSAKRYDNALFYFRNLAESRTDDIGAEAQYYIGITYNEQDSTVSAINAFEKVRTIYSAYEEWLTKSYMALGDIYVKQDSTDKAREYYRAIVSKHKGDPFGKEAQSKLRELE